MKVNMIATGSWTNIRTGCSIDTASLARNDAERLVEAIGDLCLMIELKEPPSARDARMISIEFLCGDEWKRASFSEAAPPIEVEPILEILRPLCRPLPSSVR